MWIDCEVCDGEGEEEGEFVVDADLLPFFLIGFARLLDDRTES